MCFKIFDNRDFFGESEQKKSSEAEKEESSDDAEEDDDNDHEMTKRFDVLKNKVHSVAIFSDSEDEAPKKKTKANKTSPNEGKRKYVKKQNTEIKKKQL